MTEDERTALVDELAQRMMPQGRPLSPGVRQELLERCRSQATFCLPIIDKLLAAHDLDAVRLRAQVKYLRDYAFSKACQAVEAESGKPVSKEYAAYVSGSIDGNIAVAGDRAVAQAQGRGEGTV